MATVMQLPPNDLRDFKRRFQKWQRDIGEPSEKDEALVQACHARLPAAAERRLKMLIGKSELGTLDANELEQFRRLVGRAEKIDATRLAALAELARRWQTPVSEVMGVIGWEDGDAQAARHSSRTAKSRPRSRR
jgi:hypothetical protein